jgi:hypothetical protein
MAFPPRCSFPRHGGTDAPPARLIGARYAAILARLDQRISLPVWQKLWIAVRHGLAA